MTDEQMIKALECCAIKCDCKECYFDTHESGDICARVVMQKTFDLINRQRAEIERLQRKYDLSEAERVANVKGFSESIATARAKTVKEFEDALVQELLPSGMVLIERYSINAKAVRLAIYNIAKEMVGEQG